MIMRRAMEYAASCGLTVFITPEEHSLVNGGVAHEGSVSTRLGLPAIPEAAETVAVARELESRGLKFKAEGADVSVQITVYHREKKELYNSYYPYYNPYYYRGGPMVYNSLERAIAVDIYDNDSRKQVWHSAAIGELEYNTQKREERMPEVVAKLFKDFPMQKGEPI